MDSPDWSAADSDIYLPLRVQDPVAVELAYDRYGGMAYGLALRILAEPDQAEDVVQEVFLRLWNSPASYDPTRGSFRTWLLTLIRNRSIDVLRRRQRRALPIELPSASDLVEVRRRLADGGVEVEERAEGFFTEDPSRNRIQLKVRAD